MYMLKQVFLLYEGSSWMTRICTNAAAVEGMHTTASTLGAVTVVRPDGYVGMVAPFEHVEDMTKYFEQFMLASA